MHNPVVTGVGLLLWLTHRQIKSLFTIYIISLYTLSPPVQHDEQMIPRLVFPVPNDTPAKLVHPSNGLYKVSGASHMLGQLVWCTACLVYPKHSPWHQQAPLPSRNDGITLHPRDLVAVHLTLRLRGSGVGTRELIK